MVRILHILLLSAALISLSACSSMAGNVVPKSGPSMEKVYDSMNKQKNIEKKDINIGNSFHEQQNLKNFRYCHTKIQSLSLNSQNTQGLREFRKLPNPDLHLYIYPHLAGQDQIPIPGYMTVFNVYEHDHYEINR